MRLFFAINLPQALKTELADVQNEIKNSFPMEISDAVAKWVAPENLHITLLFLGEVGDKEISFLTRAVGAALKDAPPLVLRLTKTSYGPAKKNPPQLIWLETAKNEILEKLILDLAEEIFKANIRCGDRGAAENFFGHITLARVKEWVWKRIDPEERPEIEKELDLKIDVRSIELMESRLKRSGPEYAVLQSFPLAGLD
ncbi:MAG: RNA 2',3'-cyclic phosphodiesterase [Candidatus Pacebacteria bacterium]|nr:RNA 2',3'-cyclic phosphodiesterase [Candidatus Paceibacterota bacterium]